MLARLISICHQGVFNSTISKAVAHYFQLTFTRNVLEAVSELPESVIIKPDPDVVNVVRANEIDVARLVVYRS